MHTNRWQLAGFALALFAAGSVGAMEPMYMRTNPGDRAVNPSDSARPGEAFFAKGVMAVK